MKLCSISSGSSGNCIFLGSEHNSILIDAGISGKRIEAGLSSIDRSLTEIDALLITHEHSDHIRALGILARRYEIPIYLTQGTADAVLSMTSVGKIPEDLLHVIRADEEFAVGEMRLRPFAVSHDAAEPVAFRIEAEGKKAAVVTDLGCYDENILHCLSDLNALLLESNHDVRMLESGSYPYYLKRRILGEAGHLSNEDAGRLLSAILHDGFGTVLLGHLSHENNYEPLAYETVCDEVTRGDNPYRASDFPILVAHRDVVTEAVEF